MLRILVFITLLFSFLTARSQFWLDQDFSIDFSESIRVQDTSYLNGSKVKLETMPVNDDSQGRILVVDSVTNMVEYRNVSSISGGNSDTANFAADLYGLDSIEVLYGSATGNVEQDNDFYFKPYLNRLYVPQINIPTTTSGGDGIIYQNGSSFLYAYGSNLYLGSGTGNLTSFGAGNNLAIGTNSLPAVTNGANNIAIGYATLNLSTTGSSNVAIGYLAAQKVMGNYNVYIGESSGGGSTSKPSAQYNTAIGSNTLSDVTGRYNIAIGYASGQNITTGSNNIIIGNKTYGSAGLSNRLIIESDSVLATTPLIHGDFAADSLKINGSLKVRDLSLYNGDTIVVWNPLTKKFDYRLASGIDQNLANADLTQTDVARTFDSDGGTLSFDNSTGFYINGIDAPNYTSEAFEPNYNQVEAGDGTSLSGLYQQATHQTIGNYFPLGVTSEIYFANGLMRLNADSIVLQQTPPIGTTDTILIYNKLSKEIEVADATTIINNAISGTYLKLDQTTPQTVSSGAPNFSGGINVDNDFAISTDGKISEYGNSTPEIAEILVGDGTDFEKVFDPSLMSPKQGIFHFTEFDGNLSNTSIVATATVSGAGSVSAPSSSSENSISGAVSGVWKLATGTTSTGYGVIAQTGSTVSNMLNKGVAVFETSIAFLDSATAANDYFFRTGFGYTSFAALNPSNGVYFKYNRSASGHYWICSVANGGVISNTVTATAVVEDTYTVLRIEVDQANSAAKFYINGTLVYTYSGTINANVNNNMDTEIVKTNGTTTREVLLDYMWWWMRWYTPQTSRGTFSSISGY